MRLLAHGHPAPGMEAGTAELVIAGTVLLPVLAYLPAARRLRRRGDAWPGWRDVSFAAGGLGIAWAVAGGAPGGPFTGHMVQHLVLGMAGPLLLVLARPVTLALRALASGPARRGLLALMHARPAGWLVFPPLAALLDVGGLWLLYRTELFAAVRHSPAAHGVAHAHVVAAGLLFTFAVCQVDPVRRRWSVAVRGAALLAAGAAHALLAKTLYAVPPPGTDFTTADLRAGARWMYYGGDVVEAALAVVLGLGWYRARRQGRLLVGRRPTKAPGVSGAGVSGSSGRLDGRHSSPSCRSCPPPRRRPARAGVPRRRR